MKRRGGLRVVGAVSCLLFTLSSLYPFLQTIRTNSGPFWTSPVSSGGAQTYWSFKATYVFFLTPMHPIVTEFWFQDYWSEHINHKTVELGLGIAAVLILMFTAQTFTFLSAALAIFKVKPYLFLSAALLNLFTTLCMWLVSRAFAYPHFECAFQTGFWLTLPAAALFLAAFLIGQADSKLSLFLREYMKEREKAEECIYCCTAFCPRKIETPKRNQQLT